MTTNFEKIVRWEKMCLILQDHFILSILICHSTHYVEKGKKNSKFSHGFEFWVNKRYVRIFNVKLKNSYFSISTYQI